MISGYPYIVRSMKGPDPSIMPKYWNTYLNLLPHSECTDICRPPYKGLKLVSALVLSYLLQISGISHTEAVNIYHTYRLSSTCGMATAASPRAVRRKTTWASSSAAISLAMICGSTLWVRARYFVRCRHKALSVQCNKCASKWWADC